MLVAALIFYFVDRNTQTLLNIMFIIGTFGVFLFICFIPESPRYIFMKDPTSKEGIKVLNYIAWLNGSPNRVPQDSIFDQFGQIVKEQELIDEVRHSRLSMCLRTSVSNDIVP